jgi:hypothetical protein
MAMLLAGASLAACQRSQPQVTTLPLDARAAAPLGEAPPPGGLPPAPPARIANLADYRDAYAYPDRAWNMAWAFGDSPPDYAFEDDGVSPWVWVADDDSECLAEPVPGGERYYYFLPGAYTPFYVQDPSFGYGFRNGQLAAIYDRSGRPVPLAAAPAAAATAGQYLARGGALRQAAADRPHRPVEAANWTARRALIAGQREAFARNAAAETAWRSYHDQHQGEQARRLAVEATRREAWAAQTDTRLGAGAKAAREQRLAQSLARDAATPAPSVPQMQARAVAPGAHRAGSGRGLRLAEERRPAEAAHERAARTGRTASTRAASAPEIDAASEHATDAAVHARATAAAPERHAAPPPRAFHAPPPGAGPAPQRAPQPAAHISQPMQHASPPAQHAAQPSKPPAAQAAPAPPSGHGHGGEHGGGQGKHH